MSTQYDVIVIGAGHNGLTAAALLAKAGRRVLVLERRDRIGGLAASDDFHPGAQSAGFFADTTLVQRRLLETLALEAHGLRWRTEPPGVLALGSPGDSLWLAGDPGQAAVAIGRRNERDAEHYHRYHAFLARLAPVLLNFLTEPALDLTEVESVGARELFGRAMRLRRLGRRDFLELLRLPPLSVADWLDEWFADDLLKSALALPSLASTFMGPRSPGSNALLLRQACARGPGVEGGGPALVAALERAARGQGVEIRTEAAVARVRLGAGTAPSGHAGAVPAVSSVQGVTLEDGENIDAPLVAASCHPAVLFLSLLPPRSLPIRLAHAIENIRSRGTTSQVLLALREPIRYLGHEDTDIEFARTGARLDDIERAFDAIKYREIASRPVLEIHALPGPAASILVHFTPHDLATGWDASAREQLGDRVVELLAEQTRGLDVVARQVLAPPDLAARYAIPGGSVHHGEHALDQMLLRPAAGCVGSRTPIRGLFLSGSGTHPGGGLTCLPGILAAKSILTS